ncbi:MAG TPA: creatininase family protein [Candidatus Methylomirabilis sp.]|nr:creatininase family protein [Candidatus Methylomirabilis sp.]
MAANHYLPEITQPEAERILWERGLVLIPTGSVEQHGPHLPCGTDALAALAVGRAVAPRVRGLLVSLGPLGIAPVHLGFAGTLSVKAETFMRLFRDVCLSLTRHGADKVVVLNWHGGNAAALGSVAGELQAEGRARFLIIQLARLAGEVLGDPAGLSHGGAIDTLAMLAHDPALVHLDRAGNPSPPDAAAPSDARPQGPGPSRALIADIRELLPTGWSGELAGVTVEKGRTLLAQVADAVVEQVEAVFGP